jgi:ribulose-phosphate 3-epimerase
VSPTDRRILIAPSILAADFVNLERELASIESADLVHVDVMDGHFVPNLTIGPPVVAAIKRVAPRPLDVHLMIESPETYLPHYVEAGADILGVHAETCPHLHRTLGEIRRLGARSCAVLNPSTPPEAIEYVLEEADQVLVMTVSPGFGGQSFIEAMLPKIERIRGWIEARGLAVDLEVDGGIGEENIGRAAAAGANVFVAGTSVFKQADRKPAIDGLRRAAQAALR